MALANCPLCGKLFNNALRDVCPDCIRIEEEAFHKVRDYLRENRNARPMEVSEATEISLTTIYKFLKEGRLIAAYFPGMYYECEKCGAPITKGKYCDACMQETTKTVEKLKGIMEADKKGQGNESSKSSGKSAYHLDFRNDK